MNSPLFEQFYKNFILGNHPFVRSRSVYKRAFFTGILSLLTIGISFIYLIFDLYLSVTISAPFYFLLMGFAVLSFILNRFGFYALAKVILLYSALAILFVFGTSEPIAYGNFLSYFPLILAAFALFGYRHIQYAIIFSLISIGLFLLMFFDDFQIIPFEPVGEEVVRYNLLIHFLVSLSATILILLFFIRLNYTIENYLRNNEIYLNKVMDELEASKQRLELAFKGSNAGLYDWDIKNNNIYHSPMWKNMLGYAEHELSDFTIEQFLDFTHPDDADRVKRKIEDLLTKKSRYVEEVRLQTKSGDYKWFMDSGMAIWDDQGEPVRMIGSIIDIMEMKVAEERITQQNKMLEKTNSELDQFVYSTSHDLRAPLMSILGLIDLAKVTENREELLSFLDLMTNRVNRLDEFIGEIIDFSRNSRLEVVIEDIDLFELVNEIIKDLQFIEHSDKIAVVMEMNKGFTIKTDKKRLQTIMRNLISNAFKYHNYLKDDPFIIVTAKKEKGKAIIAVVDNGDGIREEKQAHIFDMFYRGSDKSKGSGLGLYIAKEMTEKLSGKLRLKSAYGQGSEFSVELPQ